MELLVALGVAAVAGLGVWAVQSSAKRQEVWRDVARRRGATFHEPSGVFGTRPYAIEAVVGSARVFLDWYVVSTGKSSATYTRVRAMFPLPVAPRFNVYRQGFFATVGKALGTQDVVLGGSAAFDDAFMVKCDEPDLVRAVWNEDNQAAMARWLANGRAECDGHTLTLTCLGHVSDPATLDGMLDLAGGLVEVDLLGVDALATLATATVRRTAEAWDDPRAPTVHLAAPTAVTFEPVMSGGLARTRVHGSASREHPAFATAIEATGAPLAALPAGALPPTSATHLRTLAAGHLTVADGTATYTFAHIERNPRQLRAAAALIAAFSRGPLLGRS